MSAAAIVLVVPMPAIAANRQHGASRHWRVIHNERTAYWRTLDALNCDVVRKAVCTSINGQIAPWHIPERPATPLHRVTLTSSMILGGAMDDDGAMIRHKWVLDWLVSRGYLATDRRERKKDGASCRWAGLPEQRVSRKEPARITLTIAPV